MTTAEKSKLGHVAIPKEQWNLPVSFSSDGRKLVTLEQAVKDKEPALSLAKLSDDQRARIVAARIEAQPRFELAMLGAGKIDKPRAIREVKARTKVGKTLIEIEQRLIENLLRQVGSQESA